MLPRDEFVIEADLCSEFAILVLHLRLSLILLLKTVRYRLSILHSLLEKCVAVVIALGVEVCALLGSFVDNKTELSYASELLDLLSNSEF